MIKFENKNNGRYYYLSIRQDLLNQLVLTVLRGGRCSNVIRTIKFSCMESITREIQRLIQRRLKRGYSFVS